MASNPLPLAAAAPSKMQQKKERRMFSSSDDTAMMKQVQATHSPDGREVDVKPIIQIIEEILIQAIARTIDGDLDVFHYYFCPCSFSFLHYHQVNTYHHLTSSDLFTVLTCSHFAFILSDRLCTTLIQLVIFTTLHACLTWECDSFLFISWLIQCSGKERTSGCYGEGSSLG